MIGLVSTVMARSMEIAPDYKVGSDEFAKMRGIVMVGDGRIGRSRECDIALQHMGTSRDHASFETREKTLRVIPKVTTNPTLLNGEVQHTAFEVQVGDTVDFGGMSFILVEIIDEIRRDATVVSMPAQ